MQKRRKGEKEKRRKGERTFTVRLLFSSSLLLLFSSSLFLATGCESGYGSRLQGGDPFLGIHTSPAQAAASAPNNTMAQATSGPIPPLPASYTSPGTAPMASGETTTPDNPRDLRIAGDSLSPASPYPPSSGGARGGTGAARGVAPAVTVGNPEPAPPAAANLATIPASGGLGTPAPASPPPVGAAANVRTYEEAQQLLKQHGVTWQRLSGDEGEWKFACGVPNPSNPHVNKTYQTSRPFPDYLSAIRAVLAQIEQTPH